MPGVDLKFYDAEEGPVWPDLIVPSEKVIHHKGEIMKVAVIENGMTGGRPSVAFRFDLDYGHVITETSARVFCTAAKMIMARYPKLFEGD